MTPEVVTRKLAKISQYVEELAPYRDCSFDAFWRDHYKIERIIELFIAAALDIIVHLLEVRGEPPPVSYRAAFLRAGEMGLLSEKLSRSLALGVGLRNILVHEYEDIDYHLLHGSLPTILDDMLLFIEETMPFGR